ncbi:MAG: putative Membrane-fusion protein of multidrug efflux transporter [Chthonomonadaceae bacterium]|nr:putative Membrane-fusion protein of multidrug efflux transporter [Chthonomonadaceae bacterium]
MRTKLPIAIITIVAGAAVGGMLLLRQQEALPSASAQGQATPPLAVQTTHAQMRSVSRLIALPGDVRPWAETTLFAKVPGYLGTISVDRGDHVKAGQILATIQAPELQADRDQAQQNYRSALASVQGSRATEQSAEAQVQRARTAAEKAQADYQQAPAGVARAKAQLLQTQSAVRQAEAQRQQAQANLEASQSQVEKAQADLDSARADQRLAEITYTRYQGIYDKNPMLIAKQDVDTTETHAAAARGKAGAAQSALQSAQAGVKAAQAQVSTASAQIEQAQAQVTAAQEQVSIAQAQQAGWQKQVAVAAQDVTVSGKQRAVTQAKVEEVQYQAGAGRSAVGRTAAIAGYAKIRAPFAGTITKRFVDRGAFIQTASASQNAAAIVTVADLDTLRLFVNVPETEARFIRVGTPVKITLTGLPDTAAISGRVARTEGSLDPKTRSLPAEVDLPNHNGQILPGAYAMVKTVLETHPHVVSIPSLAVGSDKSGKFVFVVENGKARRVVITTGFDDGAYTEITDGLKGQEEVVVTGRDALTPNAPVRTTPWSPPTK